MKRYALVSGAMVAVFLALFGLAVALDLTVLTEDPRPWMGGGGALTAAAVGVGLLVVDVLLPVPSSVVMVLHGAWFGVVGGALLSLAGSVLAAAFGFWLGRRGRGALDRLVTPAERARGDALLARWGAAAVALTRPLPMLAEAVAILAGTSPMGWRALLGAAALGNLPPALVYAITGAYTRELADGFWVFGGVVLITGGFWLAARRAAQPDGAAP
ncbi:MAG: VTT domain-containing protein [Myxococcales bacterium]|nr:VTT domain-containing protein [Myxococcales bacterium]